MTEWIKGQPSINGQFWKQIARVEGNGRVTTTFITIRGKRGDEKMQIKQFVEQINRYTETTVGFDFRALTAEVDAYREMPKSLSRVFEGIHGINFSDISTEFVPVVGASVEEERVDNDDQGVELPADDGNHRVLPLL